MKKILILFSVLAAAAMVFATEARVESMGNNSDFIRDDVSVFENPATAFDFGNLLVGALGKLEKRDNQWERQDEWFGGWAVYPLNDKVKLGLGATLNRQFSLISQYQSLNDKDFFWIQNGNDRFQLRNGTLFVDLLDILNMPAPYGNVYAFGGATYDNFLSVAVGGRYAGYQKDSGSRNNSAISVSGGNLGVVYRFDQHSLEADINYDNFQLTKNADFLDVNDTVRPVKLSYDENSFNVKLRMMYVLSPKNTIVPVLLLDKTNILGISNTDLGAGVGFTRALYKGSVWAGMKYVNHAATYPDLVLGQPIYTKDGNTQLPPGVKESSNKLVYSFGVEKKMLWDWFTLRVGGNKVFEYLTKKDKDEKATIEQSLQERDVDAVAWGIALGTPDDRLLFDITVSEAFPYSNFLAGGEDGVMLYRISAALKF